MDADQSDSHHNSIDATLANLLETLPDRPSWYDRWRSLGPDSSETDRLSVYQEIRDSQLLPADAGFHLIAWQVDALASKHAETALRELDDRLEALESAPTLNEEDDAESGATSFEHERLLEEYHRAWSAIFTALLDEHGEHEIAALFRTNREEFDRRNEAGRQLFQGPRDLTDTHDSNWLDSLIEAVGASLAADNLMGPLGILYGEKDGYWEVDIYPTPVELIGGADDGAVVSPAFSLDLEALRSAFERIEDFGWTTIGWPDGNGPFVWIKGAYQGHELLLRILAQAPEGEEPGSKLRMPEASKETPDDLE
ncbi:hypothetical protein SAMN05444166_6805 [Singulisphaera sp. GP187]|uniref:hypothetical protein n=1 Tax=Singulisphaera sp. GP187 TaxID=1882752 RepID=UPI00092B9780|nr:hypothetical protein [Singulisphaera sp. GP187]SIO61612.1 hypothetical protein SAMN05444166_6805 [Singulisphaera sp. GP187]